MQGVSKVITNNGSKGKVRIMLNAIRQFVKEEEGAVAVEYVLLVVLIGLVFYVGAQTLGNTMRDIFNTTATNLSGAAAS